MNLLREPAPGATQPDAADCLRGDPVNFRYLAAGHATAEQHPDLAYLALTQDRHAVRPALREPARWRVYDVLEHRLRHDMPLIAACLMGARARAAFACYDSAVMALVIQMHVRRDIAVDDLPGHLMTSLQSPVELQHPVPVIVGAALPQMAGVRAAGPVHSGFKPLHPAVPAHGEKRVTVPEPSGVVLPAPAPATGWAFANLAILRLIHRCHYKGDGKHSSHM